MLEVLDDQCWGIVGRNGSGKSTLAAQIASDSVNSALVSLELEDGLLERELQEDDTDFIDKIDTGRTVRELILEVGQDRDIETLVTELGLVELLDRGFRVLSTGERRRLMIARALIQEPSILVLDEPFDGLDVEFQQQLREFLSALNVRMIIATNRLSDLDGLATHFLCVDNREVVLRGERAEIEANATFQQLMTLPEGEIKLPEVIRDDVLRLGPLIEMKSVTVIHSGREILSRLDWIVDRGENWKISGPNGCGKSTLVNLVTGDHPQCYSNDVVVFGMQRGSGESIWDVKKHIGIVSPLLHSQYRVGVNSLSVVVSGFYDSVGIYRSPQPEHVELAKQWLDIMNMADCAHQAFRSLSFGQQRLVLIARALVKGPQLLILDEPCQGLDRLNRALVLKVLDQIVMAGKTQLIYITHEAEDHLECVTHELRLGDASG